MNNLHKIKPDITLSPVELANIWHHYRKGAGFRKFIIVKSFFGVNMVMSGMKGLDHTEECTINHYTEYLSNKKINQNFLSEITIERRETI